MKKIGLIKQFLAHMVCELCFALFVSLFFLSLVSLFLYVPVSFYVSLVVLVFGDNKPFFCLSNWFVCLFGLFARKLACLVLLSLCSFFLGGGEGCFLFLSSTGFCSLSFLYSKLCVAWFVLVLSKKALESLLGFWPSDMF